MNRIKDATNQGFIFGKEPKELLQNIPLWFLALIKDNPCLFQISRNKGKWKFLLKDGIMNLEGKDYVFQKGSGEADW